MKREIAEQWITALRSGKYKQTRRVLRDKNEFCCLGVLCDISNQGIWKDENFVTNFTNSGFKSNYILPYDIINWAQMRTEDGVLDEYNTLASLNDDGKTFEEIADIIEANYERL